MSRHAFVEVSLAALKNNYLNIKNRLFPHQQIMAIVKADAYGVGALQAARLFADLGAKFFGVASIQEAIELREAGIQQSILVLSPFLDDEYELFLEYQVTPTLTEYPRAKLLADAASRQGKIVDFHFKVDTGMGRLGLTPEAALPELMAILSLKSLKLEGVFSHFPVADELDDFSLEQIKRFKEFLAKVESEGIPVSWKHIANSSGILGFNDPDFNLVRPGLILYGAHPAAEIHSLFSSQHVIDWKTQLLFQKNMMPGQTVSYARTFKVEKPMRVGVVGAGYADGFTTFNSGKAQVLIQERLVPVLGRVCMDYFMVDLTNLSVENGIDVYLAADREGVRVDDIASRTGMIPYEILTNISRRTPRFYRV